MKEYLSYIALFAALIFYSCSNGQSTASDSIKVARSDKQINSYKFIEPNTSVSYDSNLLKITRRYSNTFYRTESFDFSYQDDTGKNTLIRISAGNPTEYPPKKQRDSLALAGIEELKSTLKDTFSLVDFDKQIIDINGFSCVGIVGYDKLSKKYTTFIRCHRFTDIDNTEVNYFSKGNDLKTEYQILTPFLFAVKSYSQKEIDHEDSLIKNKYTVVVNPTETIPENFKYRPKTYIGVVAVREKLEHKILEVRLTTSLGQEIFSPNEKAQVIISSNDSDKGNVIKSGELVLVNSFGKKVSLPFTFTYVNKGPL